MIYYNSKCIYSIIIIIVISVYFLIELGKTKDGYIFEHLDISKISDIKKIFPKISALKAIVLISRSLCPSPIVIK